MSDNNEGNSPWANVGFGLILIAVGVGCYFWFSNLEEHGGRVRMHALVILVYRMLGKWGVLGVFGGLGALLTFLGIKQLVAPPPLPTPPISEPVPPSAE